MKTTLLSAKAQRNFILLLIASLFFANANAYLSGTYTIDKNGSGSRNFYNFSQAVYALSQGVTGPVVFEVADGTYPGTQISISQFFGSSATNTVTFESASGDSSKVIVSYDALNSSTDNFLLKLNGADYVTFKEMTFSRTGTGSYSGVIDIRGGSCNNSFLNNRIIGLYGSDKSGIDRALIYSGSDDDTANIFRNNFFKDGSYGFYYSGANRGSEKGTIINNNLFFNLYQGFIFLYNQGRGEVSSNLIINTSGRIIDGIYLRYCFGRISIIGNNIRMATGGTAIYYDDWGGISTERGVTANNMIYVGNGYGLYVYDADYQDIIYNTVEVVSSGAAAVFIRSGQNHRIYNNIFANTGGGIAVNLWRTELMDHNDLYSTGTYIGEFGGPQFENISTWIAATGSDSNSVSTDPFFYSTTNLHSRSYKIDGKGIPFAGITTDYDGETRNASTPDIGADEFVPYLLDADVRIINSNLECASKLPLKVRVTNYGKTNLDSIRITYVADKVTQTQKFYRLNGLAAGDDTLLEIGTMDYSNQLHYLTVTTSLPNNQNDEYSANDTANLVVQSEMAGTYSIGSAGADYPNFNSAVDDLKRRGVCGAVTFNVADGIYTEQLDIPGITGASGDNTISFNGNPNDSSKVVLTYSTSGTANNFIIQLNGGSYITFARMTLKRTGTANGTVIHIAGGAHNNRFLNNQMKGIRGSGAPTDYNIINSLYDIDSNNVFSHNRITNGNTAIWYGAANSGGYEKGTVIEYNDLDSLDDYGIMLYNQDAAIVRGNIIRNVYKTSNPLVYPMGIGINQSKNRVEVSGNYVHMVGAGYGIQFSQFNDADSARAIVSNNMVTVYRVGTTTACFGIFLAQAAYIDFYFNSVSMYGTGSYPIYISANNEKQIRLFNNIFANYGGNGSIGVSYPGYLAASDYNVFYSKGTQDMFYNGKSYDLAGWQGVIGFDKHSIVLDPKFKSQTDLHLSSTVLNGTGIPIQGITTDFDGDTRDAKKPDIGADEIRMATHDLGIIAIASPQNGDCGNASSKLGVVVINQGASTESNFILKADVTGATSVTFSETYTKSLVSGAMDTFYFAKTFSTVSGGSYKIKAYSALATDSARQNDTAIASVNIKPLPHAGYSVVKNQKSITVTANQVISGYTYSWDFGDGNTGTGSTTSHSYAVSGTYNVKLTVKSPAGCQADSSSAILVKATGIEEKSDPLEFSVYPNPVTHIMHISYYLPERSYVRIKLYSSDGREVADIKNGSETAGSHECTLNADELKLGQGIYLLQFSVGGDVLEKRVLRVE